ncbi:uncharacterized protein LOC126817312 [Patella vulgata]|uniref:uncharacterized protein LOC126817312 n=1 Tax=Patella vulgata TaxID=6465 RepID=UPI0024A87F00|nr:uncharacterized protein LOC126817312 [Patella vulgata]
MNRQIVPCFFTVLVLVFSYDLQQLDKDIEETFKCHDNPGLSVAIVKDGQTIFTKGYGVRDFDSKDKVTNETLFLIASLSKAFAATLVVKLLQKSQYTLQTTVKEILGPNFKFADDLRTEYTTVEDLLSHRTGTPPNNFIRYDNNLTRNNLIKRVRYLEGSKTFRGSFIYSNVMYGLITTIAEKLGGKKWEKLVKEEIFDPLEMTSSTFSTTIDYNNSNVARGYIKDSGEDTLVSTEFLRRWGLLCGSGCVMVNAVDMTNWMLFHLNGGKNRKGEQVLDTQVLMDMGKSRSVARSFKYYNTPEFPRMTSRDGYGLGWFIGYYDGLKIQWHSGSTFGYRALLTLYPDENLGIFTSLTGHDDNYKYRISLHNYITDKILGREPWLNVSTICSFPLPWLNDTESVDKVYKFIRPSLELSAYEGEYENKLYGNLVVYVNASRNQLEIVYGITRFSLKRFSVNSNKTEYFYGDGMGIIYQKDVSPFVFNLELQDGKIQSVTAEGFYGAKSPPIFTRKRVNIKGISAALSPSKCFYIFVLYFLCKILL